MRGIKRVQRATLRTRWRSGKGWVGGGGGGCAAIPRGVRTGTHSLPRKHTPTTDDTGTSYSTQSVGQSSSTAAANVVATRARVTRASRQTVLPSQLQWEKGRNKNNKTRPHGPTGGDPATTSKSATVVLVAP